MSDTTATRPQPQVIFPKIYDDPVAERAHRKRKLAAAFRLFAMYGFDEGVAGHITARDPEYSDRFWVNPFAMHFGQIKVSDLICVDHDGQVVEGDRPINLAAFVIHSAVHRARPQVVAAAHAHSMHGKSWSSLGRLLEPITQDACAFYNDQALLDDYTGVIVDSEEGERIATTLADKKSIILRNHGLLTVGGTVDEAVWWFIAMDRCSQAQLMAEAAGTPVLIDDEMAERTRHQVGSAVAGLFSFQPLYERIVELQPDLLE